MESLPLPVLAAIFLVAAGVVWWAGIRLTNTTDALDRRFGLSDALGGLMLLAVAAALPEIAITVSAALEGHVGLAVGNLFGGVAIHAAVLAAMDMTGSEDDPPLTSRTRTLVPVLEALLVIGMLAMVVIGSQMESFTFARVEPSALLVFVVWVVGVATIQRAGAGQTWVPADDEGGSKSRDDECASSLTGTVALLTLAAILTLGAGVTLEQTGSAIASRLGIGGLVFGATILRVAGAIPELSTGIQAVRRRNTRLAVSDIFGVSAFFMALFLLAGVISGRAVIAGIGSEGVYLAALALLLTLIYAAGFLVRSHRKVLGMGLDSLVVLLIYIVGIAGLVLMR